MNLRRSVEDAMEWLDILYRNLDVHRQATLREPYRDLIQRLSSDLMADEARAQAVRNADIHNHITPPPMFGIGCAACDKRWRAPRATT